MKQPSIRQDEPQRLASLYQLNILFTPAEERFDRITRLAQQVFGVPIALVSLVGESCQWFKSAQGLTADRTPKEISFCGHAVYRETLLEVSDAREDPDFADNPLVKGEPFIRFYAGCPVMHDGKPMGTLCLIDTKPHKLTESEREMLQSLAHWVETELRISAMGDVQRQLIAELGESRRDAMLDPLTQTWNRLGLDTLFKRELNYARHSRQPLALILVDLDHYKAVNDRYGHLAGDGVLKEVVARLRKILRPEDIIARFGGDEFVVLCANSNEQRLFAVAERIRLAVSQSPVRTEGAEISVSVTLGAAWAEVSEQTLPADLLNTADRALYEAKAAGRNCVQLLPVTADSTKN